MAARSASDTARGVQTLLRVAHDPNLKVDGYIGDHTLAAYNKAPPDLKAVIDRYVERQGFTSRGLLAPLKRLSTVTSRPAAPAARTPTTMIGLGDAYRPVAGRTKPENMFKTSRGNTYDMGSPALQNLLLSIREKESHATLGYNMYVGSKERAPFGDLSKKSLREIRQIQRSNPVASWDAPGKTSSAIGAYQIVGITLDGLVKNLKLSWDDKFTPALQDRLAVELMDERSYDLNGLVSGKQSPRSFTQKLQKLFASVRGSHADRVRLAATQAAPSGVQAA